jgi:hypothetical protein
LELPIIDFDSIFERKIMPDFYDVHCHIFSVKHIPLVTFIDKYGNSFYTALNMNKNFSIYKRVVKFIRLAEKSSAEILTDLTGQIFDSVSSSGLEFGRIVISPLIVYFEKEDDTKKLSIQVDDYKEAFDVFISKSPHKNKFLIYPFIGIDPVHLFDNNIDATIKYLSNMIKKPPEIQNGEFIGIKLYPPLDLDIDKINVDFFKYCQQEQIPITVHCAYNPENIYKPKGFISKDCDTMRANRLSDPNKWAKLIDNNGLSGLKINFAHFGGDNRWWVDAVKKMILKYENIYADISFYMSGLTVFNGEKEKADFTYSSVIKNVLKNEKCRSRILYGSDYFPLIIGLCDSEGEYRTYFDLVRDSLGEEIFKTMSMENPKNFLGL